MYKGKRNLKVYGTPNAKPGLTDIYLEVSGQPHLIGTERLPEDFARVLRRKVRVGELAHWNGKRSLGGCPRRYINSAMLRACVNNLLDTVEDYIYFELS